MRPGAMTWTLSASLVLSALVTMVHKVGVAFLKPYSDSASSQQLFSLVFSSHACPVLASATPLFVPPVSRLFISRLFYQVEQTVFCFMWQRLFFYINDVTAQKQLGTEYLRTKRVHSELKTMIQQEL